MMLRLPVRFVSLMAGLVFCQSSPSFASLQCETHVSKVLGREVRFCTERSRPDLPKLAGERAVYFMHGRGGNALSWERGEGYDQALGELARTQGALPAFTLVTFDTESLSFFSDPKRKAPGPDSYETWFIDEFMPYIEARYDLCRARECRQLVGVSMGGFGAIKTALRYPEVFFRASANCPALSPFDLDSSDLDWLQYFGRHPIGVLQGGFLLRKLRELFPVGTGWGNENDPYRLSESFASQSKGPWPELYFDVGTQDDYGFQEGHARLRQLLDSLGRTYEAVLIPGAGHNLAREHRVRMLRHALR